MKFAKLKILIQIFNLKPRLPDFVIKRGGATYLNRWHLIPRNRWLNIYLHQFLNSDDAIPHDHPWWSLSIGLWGGAVEERHNPGLEGDRVVAGGSVVVRSPSYRHRMIIENGSFWTLFITGPTVREWGFWPSPDKFVHWREHEGSR